jgi:hypothetical protein
MFLKMSRLDEMNESYTFPGVSVDNGTTQISDLNLIVVVNTDTVHKTVTAHGYLTPDNGETYPDMPYPLNELYSRLRTIVLSTGQIAETTTQFLRLPVPAHC